MNKFSKLFAVMFLVSSVTAFAVNPEDAAKDTSATVGVPAQNVSATASVTDGQKNDAQAAQTKANKAEAKNSYVAKAKAFAGKSYDNVKHYAFTAKPFDVNDKAKGVSAFLKRGVNFGVRPVAVLAAAFVAYKLYTNRAQEADEADEFEDEEENA